MALIPYNKGISEKSGTTLVYDGSFIGSDSVPIYVDKDGLVHTVDVRKQKVSVSSDYHTIIIGGDSTCTMYYHEMNDNATVELVPQDGFSTFELCIKMPYVYSITFPNEVKWLDNSAPDMSEVGVYYLVFRYDTNLGNWYANLQGMWSL